MQPKASSMALNKHRHPQTSHSFGCLQRLKGAMIWSKAGRHPICEPLRGEPPKFYFVRSLKQED